MSAVVVQILVATFLSVTMMGWWFPGRMLIVGVPAVRVRPRGGAGIRLPRPAQLVAAIAGGYSLLVTVAAGRGGVGRRGRARGRPVHDERAAVPGGRRRLPAVHVVVGGDDLPQRRVAGWPLARPRSSSGRPIDSSVRGRSCEVRSRGRRGARLGLRSGMAPGEVAASRRARCQSIWRARPAARSTVGA